MTMQQKYMKSLLPLSVGQPPKLLLLLKVKLLSLPTALFPLPLHHLRLQPLPLLLFPPLLPLPLHPLHLQSQQDWLNHSLPLAMTLLQNQYVFIIVTCLFVLLYIYLKSFPSNLYYPLAQSNKERPAKEEEIYR